VRIIEVVKRCAAATLLVAAAAAWAADPPGVPVAAKTADLELSARLILDRDAQLRAVGSDLSRQYVIVELRVTPRQGGGRRNQPVQRSGPPDAPTRQAREKEMPLGETRQPVSGYLYFPVDPKQKPKNFHLHYKGPRESAELRFR